MTRRRWSLRRALELLHRHRPEAAPNAGYMAALTSLEQELFGEQTVKVREGQGLGGRMCASTFLSTHGDFAAVVSSEKMAALRGNELNGACCADRPRR